MGLFDGDQAAHTLGILTVCLGNVCRSPLAEQLLRSRLDGDVFQVRSAGLHAAVGMPMDSMSAERSILHGGTPGDKRGEQLTDRHATWAQLIMTMTTEQRNELVQAHPRAALRTFTLAEFSKLLDFTVPESSPREKVYQAMRARGRVHLTAADDIIDPIGASAAIHDQVASTILAHVERIASGLSISASPSGR